MKLPSLPATVEDLNALVKAIKEAPDNAVPSASFTEPVTVPFCAIILFMLKIINNRTSMWVLRFVIIVMLEILIREILL